MTPEDRLALAFATDHPLETARLLEQASPDEAAGFLERLAAEAGAALFQALAPAAAATCFARLSDAGAAALLEALPLDVAGTALRTADPSRRDGLLVTLESERQDALRIMLGHGDNTAGALADPLALSLPQDITVREAQRRLRGTSQHLFYDLYVLAADRTLAGVLALPELMAADPAHQLSAVMQRNPVRLDARADVPTLAAHPAWRDFDALPVVDDAGRLVGAIRHKTIRQMGRESRPPMMATLVGLSELYWTGLAGILSSLRAPPAQTREADLGS